MTNLENNIKKILVNNGVAENKVAMVMATVLNLIVIKKQAVEFCYLFFNTGQISRDIRLRYLFMRV